jgi:hypothetical protein
MILRIRNVFNAKFLSRNRKEIPYSFSIGNSRDFTGSIFFAEPSFPVSRIYFIKEVKHGETRGRHAHKELFQIFICINGSYKLKLSNAKQNFLFDCDRSDIAVFVPPGYWRELTDFSEDAICLVLASEKFDEGDYIRDWKSYLHWLGEKP